MTAQQIKLLDGTEWKLNTAYNGDCLDFMRLLPDKCIDLVLTDPPYGINVDHNIGRRKCNKASEYKKVEWDSEIPHEDIFKEIIRISKNQIIWGGNYFTKYLETKKCWLFWDKMFSNDVSFSAGELAWTSFDSPVKKFIFNPPPKSDGIHATQKPLKLFKWCLEKYAPENSIIFDPFLGSFTTAVACHHYGLKWLGCEKDEDYFKAGTKRYERETLQNFMDFGI